MTVFNITLDCAVAPASTPSDAGVAGAGVRYLSLAVGGQLIDCL